MGETLKREVALDTTISSPAAFAELRTQQSLSVPGRQGGMGNLLPLPPLISMNKVQSAAAAAALAQH